MKLLTALLIVCYVSITGLSRFDDFRDIAGEVLQNSDLPGTQPNDPSAGHHHGTFDRSENRKIDHVLPGECPRMPVEKMDDLWVCDRCDFRRMEDEYLLGELIGRGSFSQVYKCLRKGRTEWTCKVLEKRRLSRNMTKSALPKIIKLRHPNIINIKEVFETESTIQLITECVSGGEIFEKIVERGQYSEREAARAVREVLQALEYLHSEGIAHGDVKPENLLYESDMDEAKLKMSDFGLRQLFLTENLVNNNISDYVYYCAPEVLLGTKTDTSADLWSLGAVIYIMLCGYEPFRDEGNISTCESIIKGDFSFPSPLWDDISPSAKELIAALLNVDPKKRPTAEEALNHPWTQGITSPAIPRNKMITGLREYNAAKRFRVASKAVLATRRVYHLLQMSQDGDENGSLAGDKARDCRRGEEAKEFRRWCPVEGSSEGEAVGDRKLPTLTTR